MKPSNGPNEFGPNCPSLEDWGMYCADEMPEDITRKMLGHLSECAACSGLLVDMAEEPQIAPMELKSSSSEWQRDMAARLEAESTRKVVPIGRGRSWYRSGWVSATAVAASLLLCVVSLTSPTVLLWGLNRYSDFPLPYRVVGSSPIGSTTRGTRQSPGAMFNLIQALLKFEDGITWESGKSLQARSRVRFFERPDPAGINATVDSLAEAHTLAPADISIANDLAIALLWRSDPESRFTAEGANCSPASEPRSTNSGLNLGRNEDSLRAIEILGEALQRNHGEPSLLFNLALAEERALMFDKAEETWKSFRDTNPSQEWISQMNQSIKRIQCGRSARSSAGKAPDELIFGLAEAGFKPADHDVESIARDIADTPHNDPWLHDFLAAADSPASRSALRPLQQGAKILRKYPDKSEPLFKESLASFLGAGNRPGADFAAYELVYSLDRQGTNETQKECASVAEQWLPEITRNKYKWLEVEMTAELAVCLGKQERFGPAYETHMAAHTIAAAAHFDSLELRTLSATSSYLRQTGAYRDAIPMDSQILTLYWNGVGADFNAFQAYYGLASSLAKLQYHRQHWYLGQSFRT